MQRFATEIEDPIVAKDIVELEKKIALFQSGAIDPDQFRSLRLARGVYGQRQPGVQMIRIKFPYGKATAQQLRRLAEVTDTYATGNLHITTRQDIQLHYVSLDDTPQLWSELEKDQITLREACGNTVRNVTASIWAGISPDEPFDVSPYAAAFFEYFLRNPIGQDMGRKIKVSFSSSDRDEAIGMVHDLGFIPVATKNGPCFKVLLGGGIGAQPRSADVIENCLPADQIIPLSEAIIRVFDRLGERNRRQKARLKFLVEEMGVAGFMAEVNRIKAGLPYETYAIAPVSESVAPPMDYPFIELGQDEGFARWKEVNVFFQKQTGYCAVGIPVAGGNFSSETARKLADLMDRYSGASLRFTQGQSILLRFVPEQALGSLYQELGLLQWNKPGFHKINDITSCPGTTTCNLGIANSVGLSQVLKQVIEDEFPDLVALAQLDIKISGCMNACGQHTIAAIGFQGMTVKSGANTAPATQVLLGGGVLGNGQGRFGDKVLKVPSKRTPDVLRWLLTDFNNLRQPAETYLQYYLRKGTSYFYENLVHYSSVDDLTPSDFIDWGENTAYEKAIGIGECAGVTIDLVQTLLYDAQHHLDQAQMSIADQKWSDAIYLGYAALVRGAKAVLTSKAAKINSHESIIEQFDHYYPEFMSHYQTSLQDWINLYHQNKPDQVWALSFLKNTTEYFAWIKSLPHEKKS